MARSFQKKDPRYQISEGLLITEIPEDKKPEQLPDPPKKQPEDVQVQTERLTTPEIVEQPQNPPPSQDDLRDARIDIDPQEGIPDDGTPDPGPASVGGGTGIVEDKTTVETGPQEIVDIDAKFDGNWKKFLETNLVPEIPVDNGAPAGRYSVVVRFVVDTDGSFSQVEALTNHGYGMEQEAIRVVKKSKKWEPASLNGHVVKAYKKQVIVFVVEE